MFDVVALRPFVPASDFETSLGFYMDLSFGVYRLGDGLASLEVGPFAFLLRAFRGRYGFAENYMMHLLVKDLGAWWTRIVALDLGRAVWGAGSARA